MDIFRIFAGVAYLISSGISGIGDMSGLETFSMPDLMNQFRNTYNIRQENVSSPVQKVEPPKTVVQPPTTQFHQKDPIGVQRVPSVITPQKQTPSQVKTPTSSDNSLVDRFRQQHIDVMPDKARPLDNDLTPSDDPVRDHARPDDTQPPRDIVTPGFSCTGLPETVCLKTDECTPIYGPSMQSGRYATDDEVYKGCTDTENYGSNRTTSMGKKDGGTLQGEVYICDGPLPKNAQWHGDEIPGLGMVWKSGAKDRIYKATDDKNESCDFKCNKYYKWKDGECKHGAYCDYSALPEHANFWETPNWNRTGARAPFLLSPYRYNDGSDPIGAEYNGYCAFYCLAGYTWSHDENTCIRSKTRDTFDLDSCEYMFIRGCDTEGLPENAHFWTDQYKNPQTGSYFLIHSSFNNVYQDCDFDCDKGYTWVKDKNVYAGGTCIKEKCEGNDCDEGGGADNDGGADNSEKDDLPQNCEGDIPDHAQWYDTSSDPPTHKQGKKSPNYQSRDKSTESCDFYCEEGYRYDAIFNKCVEDKQYCHGPLPQDGVWWDTSGNTPLYKLGQQDPNYQTTDKSTESCDFHCKNGADHRENTRTGDDECCVRSELPENAEWVTVSSLSKASEETLASVIDDVVKALTANSFDISQFQKAFERIKAQKQLPPIQTSPKIAPIKTQKPGISLPDLGNGRGNDKKDNKKSDGGDDKGADDREFDPNDGGDIDSRGYKKQKKTAHYDPTGSSYCAFTCKDGYEWDGKACIESVIDLPKEPCKGQLPQNAVWHDTSNIPPYYYYGSPYAVYSKIDQFTESCDFECISDEYQYKNGECVKSCTGQFTDPRDGQVYTKVQIGDQCWMRDNLNYGEMKPYHSIKTDNQTNDQKVEKFCYDNKESNCDRQGSDVVNDDMYGGLYQWHEAMGLPYECRDKDCSHLVTDEHQGICPDGWHVPDTDEWHELESYYATPGERCEKNRDTFREQCTDAGTDLKMSTQDDFKALMAGRKWKIDALDRDGFESQNKEAYFVSTGEYRGGQTYPYRLVGWTDGVLRDSSWKDIGMSLRCIQDTKAKDPSLCPVGHTRCSVVDAHTLDRCNGFTWEPYQICPYGCEDGACNPEPDCEEGETKCIGNHQYSCEDGQWSTTYIDCVYGCENGSCKRGDISIGCQNGETRCGMHESLEQCSNGLWHGVQVCENGCSNGKCNTSPSDDSPFCRSGARQCNGENVKICYDNRWTTQYCDNGCEDGVCIEEKNRVCVEGSTRCDGVAVETCEDNEWTVSYVCLGSCQDGKCVKSNGSSNPNPFGGGLSPTTPMKNTPKFQPLKMPSGGNFFFNR